MESPAPSPEMVAAARRHLTDVYCRGVDRLLWDTEKRLMADSQAVRAVLAAAAGGEVVDALDLGGALVLAQSARLDLDRTEYELFTACYAAGLSDEAIAAVLELPDEAASAGRYRWLRTRHNIPTAENGTESVRAESVRAESVRTGDTAGRAAARAGRRAEQARTRAAQAARRQRELGQTSQRGAESRREHAEQATALAGEARVLANEAHERVALGLLRAADRLDICAAACIQLADSTGARQQLQRAQEYHQDAQRYRQMAASYRELGTG